MRLNFKQFTIIINKETFKGTVYASQANYFSYSASINLTNSFQIPEGVSVSNVTKYIQNIVSTHFCFQFIYLMINFTTTKQQKNSKVAPFGITLGKLASPPWQLSM
jgi:hypothetical protein